MQQALHFAFHPGNARARRDSTLRVGIASGGVGGGRSKVVTVAPAVTVKEWQTVELPLERFDLRGPLESLILSGNVEGTFYLADLRLVAVPPRPTTAVVQEPTGALAQSFSLEQNFPNPFNSGTAIRFALPKASEVELAFYNLAGQEVVRLVEGMCEPGNYTVRWDGRDEQGRELATGVYLYRLRARGRMETRKLLLLR